MSAACNLHRGPCECSTYTCGNCHHPTDRHKVGAGCNVPDCECRRSGFAPPTPVSAGKASAPNPHPSPAAMAVAAIPTPVLIEPWEQWDIDNERRHHANGATTERRRMMQVMVERSKAAVARNDDNSIGAASELNALVEELLASLDA